jgi:arylsulfatase
MGELPIRTGMTTVGQAGAKIGIPAEACTIATALKAQGYATGQFGKNHLGDLNEFLPTVHGFDEFFGYLYHLDAMEDPAHPNYPQDLLDKVGPRNMVHSWATDTDDATVMPRWGKVGKQKIEDAGTLYPERMKTVDGEIRDLALKFIEKAKTDNKPFFCWLNPTRMHIVTHLSDKYEKMRNSENGWSEEEAGIPARRRHRFGPAETQGPRLDDNTIVVFTTTTAPNSSHRPDGEHHSRRARGRSWKAASSSVHPALARPRSAIRTERHFPWTGSRRSCCCRQSRHHQPVAQRCETRRPDLQEPSRWL